MPKRRQIPLLLVMILAYLPHLRWMPWWVSVFFALLLGLHLLSTQSRYGRTVSFLRLPLALLALAGVLITWGGKIGPWSGGALLSLMLGIKALEINGYRDRIIALLTACVLIFITVLFSESLLMGAYILGVCWVILGSLCSLHGLTPRAALHSSGLLLVQALPLALIVFLFFPRLPGSIFGLNQVSTSGRTGLSPTLSPGSISQLIPSRAPAFRAAFDGPPPPQDRLYWRAAVLCDYDGREWTPGFLRHRTETRPVQGVDNLHRMHITLEAHQSHMLPALDIPIKHSQNSLLAPGRVLRSQKPVTHALRYQLTSATEVLWPPLLPNERQACISIDTRTNPRTQDLVQRICPAQAAAQKRLSAIETFFDEHDFAYSLSPPLLPRRNPIDAFLFQTRAGYCEHYAQAAAWMARAAGIPARIVVGYQGGKPNPMGDYILVRQSDAHAWVEVWLPKQGWTRMDPTSLVAPQRIEQGVDRIHPDLSTSPVWDVQGLQWMQAAWDQAQMTWDALNYSWREWVVGYTLDKQSRFLTFLGLRANVWSILPTVIGIVLGAFLLSMLILAGILYRSREQKQDQSLVLYRRFLQKLGKIGIRPSGHEGPQDVAQQVIELRPDLQDDVDKITNLYIAQRFQPQSESQGLRKLRQAVRSFRPRTIKPF